jgi:two-component sensor histidine kinase
VIRVADEGPGPSPEDWAAPGLGLQLVRQVVEQGLRGALEPADGIIVARFGLDREDGAAAGRAAQDTGGGR